MAVSTCLTETGDESWLWPTVVRGCSPHSERARAAGRVRLLTLRQARERRAPEPDLARNRQQLPPVLHWVTAPEVTHTHTHTPHSFSPTLYICVCMCVCAGHGGVWRELSDFTKGSQKKCFPLQEGNQFLQTLLPSLFESELQ